MKLPEAPPHIAHNVALACVVWMLVVPRIELISLGGSSLRLEDLVSALLVLSIVAGGGWFQFPGFTYLKALTGVAILSAFYASVSGGATALVGLLYAVRPLQYLMVLAASAFLITSVRGSRRRLEQALAAATVLNTCLAIAQALLGLTIGVSKFSNERAAGLTAGPYELGAISAALAIYWAYRKAPILAASAVVSLLLSESRVSLLAFAAACLVGILLSRRTRSRLVVAPPAALAIVVTLMAVVATPFLAPQPLQDVKDRVYGTNLQETFESATAMSSSYPDEKNSTQYIDIAYRIIPEAGTIGSADASGTIRFARWSLLASSMDSPVDLLIGLGPGYAGPSVDGSFTRIAVETGLIGVVLWFLFLVRLWRSCPSSVSRAIIVSLVVGAVFIDTLFSMRVMITVLLAALMLGATTEKPARASFLSSRMPKPAIESEAERE